MWGRRDHPSFVLLLLSSLFLVSQLAASPLSSGTESRRWSGPLPIVEFDPPVSRQPATPTTPENPTKKRQMVITDATSTIIMDDSGITINNGGGGTSSPDQISDDGELTTANKITIGLAVPGAIAGLVGLILYARKWRNRHKKKIKGKGAGESASDGMNLRELDENKNAGGW